MIDDRKDDVQSLEELDLGYSNTSEIGDDNNTQIDDSLNQSYFKPLSEEETYIEETSEEEITDSNETVEIAEDIEEVEETEIIEETEEVEETEENVDDDKKETIKNDSESKETSSVDTEVDEYGNTVEVFATMRSSNASTFTVNDSRLPSTTKKPNGTVSHFGETKGGINIDIVADQNKWQDRFKFQGTARPSLVFNGGILNANVTVSMVKYSSGKIEIEKTNSASVIKGPLSMFLVNAANEKIDEINGVKPATDLKYIDDRIYLTLALSAILSANDTQSGSGKPPALELTFKELDSLVPKQTTIKFAASTIFDWHELDVVKNIINQDSLVSNQGGSKGSKNISNINLNADGIAVNFDLKAQNIDDGLKTNTRYEFVAPNKDLLYFLEADNNLNSGSSQIGYVEGLTMGQFKTSKQTPIFETYSVLATGVSTTQPLSYISTEDELSDQVPELTSNIDFDGIYKTVFIDYDYLTSTLNSSNVALDVRGTSIKFKALKVFDKDETISKIEIEDDRMNKYPVTLSPEKEDDLEQGAYLKVTGLQRSTPYLFRKLHITAKPGEEESTKTFQLVKFDSFAKDQKAKAHNIAIRTSAFTEPKLFIELDPNKAFVSTSDGSFSSTLTTSEVAVFMPKLDVELPNKIKMPAVKNDKTSLRYVIEVEKSDLTIKNLTVNGLNGEEKYKVERVDGKDKVYFILTLSNLTEKRDYGFLILELTYTDLDERELISRQVLNGINKITNLAIGSSGTTTIKQYPDESLDNTTGPELTGKDIFNVTLFEATNLEARQADIPVFIDDINSKFLRLQFTKPESNPDVEVTIEDSSLKFRNLRPKTDVVYKLDFIWKDDKGSEQMLSKYAKISTPAIPSVDVKDAKITTTSTTAEIVFELHSVPKTPITTVTLSDSKINFIWNKDTLTLSLKGLKPETEYKDLIVNFKIESGLITKYKLKTFKTTDSIAAPTGPVAEFVARVYEASLGRKPEVEGWRFWTQKLESKEISVLQFMYNLFTQEEFTNKSLSKIDFIKMMYLIVVGREAEEEGQAYWERKYDEYNRGELTLIELRRKIAFEMMSEQEFKDYVNKIGLKY